MTRRVCAVWLVLVGVTLGGCGITAESEPREVDPPRGPFNGLTSAAPSEPGTASERLCLVRDNTLTAVTRSVPDQISLDRHLQLLMQGPTDAERAAGYTSALTGTIHPRGTTQAQAIATVDIGERIEGTGRSDEVLAFGQVVCTLTTRPGVAAVAFTHERQPLAVPRADGALVSEPLTPADYAALLSPD